MTCRYQNHIDINQYTEFFITSIMKRYLGDGLVRCQTRRTKFFFEIQLLSVRILRVPGIDRNSRKYSITRTNRAGPRALRLQGLLERQC
ncbi:MAG: hypothetical protein J5526_04400 [Bacteroidales bacterium]|nr:hypothetical protein [Bacteroidales bacterium]